jgi:hypothetical protein
MTYFFKIFDSKISPILLYGSEIWGTKNYDVIESIHTYACKRFLCIKQSSSNHVARGECGRYPLYIYSYKRVVKYWYKIMCMPDSRLVKKCYYLLLLDDNNGKINWVSQVKHMLYSFGFGYIWEQQFINNISKFMSEFISRLKCSYEQDWHAALSISSKSFLYCSFKINFGLEVYLENVTILKYRAALAQLRCCSHQLRIETGRYKKELRSERLCLTCGQDFIEDEFHFVLVCNRFQQLRCKYIPFKYYNNPTITKFNILMSSSNVNTIQQLSIFVSMAMHLRNV